MGWLGALGEALAEKSGIFVIFYAYFGRFWVVDGVPGGEKWAGE